MFGLGWGEIVLFGINAVLPLGWHVWLLGRLLL